MKVAIVGCSHAGIICALRTLEEFPDAKIVMYEKLHEVSFISQAIPQYLLGHEHVVDFENYVSVQGLRELGIEVRTDTTVHSIDSTHKTIAYSGNEEAEAATDSYDKLVMATGSYPVLPHFDDDGDQRAHNVFFIKVLDDAKRLGNLMHRAEAVVIIGAGMIGVEIARIFAANGVHVTLVQAHQRILNRYVDPEVSDEFTASLRQAGVDVRLGSLVTNIREFDGRTVAYTDDNQSFTADGVLLTAGFHPNSFLLGAQVELGDMGAFKVDEYMRTSAPDVFAIGDCATTHINLSGRDIYLPHASQALRSGAIAAINLAGPRRPINSSQGTFFVPIEGMSLAVTGLTAQEAREVGFNAQLTRIDKGLLDGQGTLTCWLVYDRTSHQVLGFQAKGVKRAIASVASAYANFYSLAIEQGRTVEDLEFTDLYFEYGFSDPMGLPQMFALNIRQQEAGRPPVVWQRASARLVKTLPLNPPGLGAEPGRPTRPAGLTGPDQPAEPVRPGRLSSVPDQL